MSPKIKNPLVDQPQLNGFACSPWNGTLVGDGVGAITVQGLVVLLAQTVDGIPSRSRRFSLTISDYANDLVDVRSGASKSGGAN